jgi:hypothetical protein
MVKTSTLSKKLASYSALATAVLAINHEADAQIIYTDLNPPIVIPNPIQFRSDYDTSAYLDLNNDGIADFKFTASGQFRTFSDTFTYSYSTNASINVNGLHKDSVNRVGVYTGLIPTSVPNSAWASNSVMLAKDELGKVTTFESSRTFPIHTDTGNFYYVTNKYLPLKFKNNGNTYYGWARLITIAANQLLIADYAYNSIPNSPIAAGNTGCMSAPITPVVTVKNDTLESTSANKYQWYFDGAPVASDTLEAVTRSQQGYYAVLTTDVNGCLSESQAKYFSCYSVKPMISESSGFLNPSCVPADLQENNLVSGTYIQWLRNGDAIPTATVPAYLADSSGSYSAEFIDSGKTCYLLSDTLEIIIDTEHPTVNLTGTDTLKTQQFTSYQWYRDNVKASGDTNQYYIPTDSGTYYVIITDAEGCSFKSPDYFFTNTGISSALLPEQISIYAYDKRLHVLFTDETLIGSPLHIYNMLGQEVYSTILTTGQTEIDMSNLLAGFYIVEAGGKTSSVTKKIVIE